MFDAKDTGFNAQTDFMPTTSFHPVTANSWSDVVTLTAGTPLRVCCHLDFTPCFIWEA